MSQVNPIYMAKQAASLDLISNGRFMLGVGIGWLKEEFDALGVSRLVIPLPALGADPIEGIQRVAEAHIRP